MTATTQAPARWLDRVAAEPPAALIAAVAPQLLAELGARFPTRVIFGVTRAQATANARRIDAIRDALRAAWCTASAGDPDWRRAVVDVVDSNPDLDHIAARRLRLLAEHSPATTR